MTRDGYVRFVVLANRTLKKSGRLLAVSLQQFVDRLDRSGLLSSGELESLLAATSSAERPSTAEGLARWLVHGGQLTPFQARAVYLARSKGLVIGNYVILDLLGSGGMGQVYKARHRRMKRVVALKLLALDVAKNPKVIARFHQEVEAAARLMHPNIVTAFDADEADGKHFLVMEYVAGRDLASIVSAHGRLSVTRSLRYVLDTARGLDYAHRHGVVHRDIKPSNLLVTKREREVTREGRRSTYVKILDMGLARIEAEAEAVRSDLTQPGIVMGTMDYMSPEQAINTHEADHRSDIYSLGITLHYLLLGSVPFTGRTAIEQVVAHREARIPSLSAARSDVPSALDPVFERMVAKRPQDRFQSMAEVVRSLEGLLSLDDSATDMPIILDESPGDAALGDFLSSMSGQPAARRRAATTMLAVDLTERSDETFVSSDETTSIGRRVRTRKRKGRPIPWGPVLIHASWSLALLGLAIWMLLSSR